MELRKKIFILIFFMLGSSNVLADWLPERTVNGIYFGVPGFIMYELDAPIGFPDCPNAAVLAMHTSDNSSASMFESAFENKTPLQVNSSGPNAYCSGSGLSIIRPYFRFVNSGPTAL